MSQTFEDFGIRVNGGHGETTTTCPQCSHTRKKKTDKCLSVNTVDGVWHCHHCGWSGCLNGKGTRMNWNHRPKQSEYVKPKYNPGAKLSGAVIEYFRKRGISEAVLIRNKIGEGIEFMPQIEGEVNTIQFPYFESGEVVNVKFRDWQKHFKMVKGAKRTLYGHDDISGDTLVWTEGEIDKLSVEMAGIMSCVSVPDGAPAQNTKDYSTKFQFLADSQTALNGVKTHVLAVDNDVPGKTLENELARRLGHEKCRFVIWPDGCKYANDVLVKHGAAVLRECIDAAKPYPIAGIFTMNDIADSVAELYASGLEGGAYAGWPSLELKYSVRPGEWTLVTGIPSHGKSEFIDALMVNLAESEGWVFGICSPENQPLKSHVSKLLEKKIRKPFREGFRDRMTPQEMMQGLGWLQDHFYFILPDEQALNVDSVLQLAKALVFRNGIKGLVIDPWNELDHSRPSNLSETEYISQSLTKIRRFARTYGVHIWLVVHPTKLCKDTKGSYPVPSPYDVSGSAHWRNKADNCLCVWRDLLQPDSRNVQIHVQKIRFKEIGKLGVATLTYEYQTGRYLDTGRSG